MKRKQMGQESIGDRFQSNAHKAQWLLAKMIRCGECGKAYVGVRRNKVMWEGGKKKKHLLNRYACSGHINQGNSKCRSFYIDQQFLENAVVSLVKNEIVRPMRLREIEDAVHKRLKQMQSSRDDTEKAYYARLQEINTGIDRFYDAIATGLDPDVCKQKIDELQQQKAFLEGELRDKAAGLRAAEAFSNDMLVIRKMAKNFETEFALLPFDKRRLLVLHFVERIDILDYSTASVILRIPKLTPGKTLMPPMAKKTRREIELGSMGGRTEKEQQKASPDCNQVRLSRLPEWVLLDENNWFSANHLIDLPIYLGNGFVVSPYNAIGKVGLFACR